MKITGCRNAALATLCVFLLAACGGDGGASALGTPATGPMVSLTYGVKQVQFSWPAVAGATYYRLFERAVPGAAFTQVDGDFAATGVSHDIALHRRLNATYRVDACNSVGCTPSNELGLAANVIPAIGYFKASNTGRGDEFGLSIALSADGTTLAVGAPYEASRATGINGDQADNSASRAGAVYVFTRIAGLWSQQAYVKGSNTELQDTFGISVALSADGSTLAVGTPSESSSATGINGNQADNSTSQAGAVYVFTRTAGTWTHQAYVKASTSIVGHQFGNVLTLSADGNTMAVAAPGDRSNAVGINGNQLDTSSHNAGAVYVFTRTAGAWSQQAYVKASNTKASNTINGFADLFGWAVTLSGDGNALAVGAPCEESNATVINGDQGDNSALCAGAVYVFTRAAGVWSQQAYVKASNTEAEDFFGVAVALSANGNTLAIGASVEDSNASGINGNQADNSISGAGAVYVFTRAAGTWTQQAYVKASNTAGDSQTPFTTSGGFFGFSVALSADGNTLAVGSPREGSLASGVGGDQRWADTHSGAVYVFARAAGAWSQQAYVKAPILRPALPTGFGRRIALSSDGNTLAVADPGEESNAVGINGNQADTTAPVSGAVYLY